MSGSKDDNSAAILCQMRPGKGGVSKHLEKAGSQSIHKGSANAALRSGTRSQIPKQVTARKL